MKKGYSVDRGRGICPLFSSPPRGIRQLKSPHPREFAIQGKKMLMPGGQPGGGGGWLGAGGIDWCINRQHRLVKTVSKRLFSAHHGVASLFRIVSLSPKIASLKLSYDCVLIWTFSKTSCSVILQVENPEIQRSLRRTPWRTIYSLNS